MQFDSPSLEVRFDPSDIEAIGPQPKDTFDYNEVGLVAAREAVLNGLDYATEADEALIEQRRKAGAKMVDALCLLERQGSAMSHRENILAGLERHLKILKASSPSAKTG